MAAYQNHPHNPLGAGESGEPRELGHTRVQNGRLEYQNPMDNAWSKSQNLKPRLDVVANIFIEPAIRLETIRPRLVQEDPPSSYSKYSLSSYQEALS